MKYFYLLFAGVQVSLVHLFLVWHHRENRRYSISEHAILSKKSHLLYITSHAICDVLFVLFSYQFYVKEHALFAPFYLNIVFAVLDFAQAVVPSRGKTELAHFIAAYVSWFSYLASGVLALFMLDIPNPYQIISVLLLVPILGMFVYMHFNRSKLYPFQLVMVPMFLLYLLAVTIGAI